MELAQSIPLLAMVNDDVAPEVNFEHGKWAGAI